jgi:hypothetical protein
LSTDYTPQPKLIIGAAVIGLLGIIISYFAAGAERFFANWLLWFMMILTVGLGTLFITSLEHVVRSRWSVPLRRVPERFSSLVIIAIPLAIITLLGLKVIYPWTFPGAAADPLIAKKMSYLNIPFFIIRVAICFLLWGAAYAFFVKGSIKQDTTKDPAFNFKARRIAGPFIILFAASVTIAAVDWMMSLEPHWFSTIFGIYVFAGCMVSGLCAMMLGTIYLINQGRLKGIGPDHIYNIGALMFAFTVFWTYIAFAQFMLIWYGNIPEVAQWVKPRTQGEWAPLAILLIFIHFLVPFFALVGRDSKSYIPRLRWVSILLLFAHYVDLYWVIFPALKKGFFFGWVEIAFAIFFIPVSVWWLKRSMTRGEDMPVGDPRLQSSLEFHL